jgi:molecular chaperone DnaK (HSP70)
MTTTPPHPWLGIDLGTCNSSAAIKNSPDTVETIQNHDRISPAESFLDNSEGHKNFPSFILFDEDGQIEAVGMAAKEKAHVLPDRVVWGIKRLLGRTYTELRESGELSRFPFRIRPNRKNGQCLIVVGNESYTPEALCTKIIRKIKSEAEAQTKTELDSAVVSVPAYFDPLRVSPIVEAAREAGFSQVKTIPEPVAAALAYHFEITARPRKILVFDLGAGTLDVTVGLIYHESSEQDEYRFQVVKNTGDTRLGGMDMDDRLVRLIGEKCNLSELSKAEETEIRRHAELAKIRLSTSDNSRLQFSLQGGEHSCSISRRELKAALKGRQGDKDLLEAARHQIMAAINEANWRPQEIERLILIGGPTLLPCIRDVLDIVFHGNLNVAQQIESFYSGEEIFDRMSTVAAGAALSIDRSVDDKVPAGYGFENIEFDEEHIVQIPGILVPRDSGYPFRSQHHNIEWTNRSGLFEFKILQQIPESEVEQFGFEYKFVGIQKFAVRNPDFCSIAIQMGYNANKELETTFTNTWSDESVTYLGVVQSACIGMHYPLKVKRPPELNRNRVRRIPPDSNTVSEFIKWAGVTAGYLQRRADNHPLSNMTIAQILDELTLLLKNNTTQASFEAVFTQIHSLIWNANSTGILSQDIYNELSNHLASFESQLFRLEAA